MIGQRIAVHAAKRRPKQWDLDLMMGLGRDELPDGYDFGFDGEPVPTLDVPLGKVVATAVLTDAVEIQELKDDYSVDFWRGDVIAIGKSVVSGGLRGLQVDRYGDFTVGRWMWVLEDLQRLEVPVGAIGRQGLWEWTEMPDDEYSPWSENSLALPKEAGPHSLRTTTKPGVDDR